MSQDSFNFNLSQEIFHTTWTSVQNLINEEGVAITALNTNDPEILEYQDGEEDFMIEAEKILLKPTLSQDSGLSQYFPVCGNLSQESTDEIFVNTYRNEGTNIPSNTEWPGEYEFGVTFDNVNEKSSKSTSWVYSEPLNKLFININSLCKMKFKFDKTPPSNAIIRALPIFCKDDHLQHPVVRCTIHKLPTDITNTDATEILDHFVRCESASTKYEINNNNRLSVTVPFEKLQAGAKYFEVLYKFMCFSSCPEPLNRKPLQVIFTLEVKDQVVGRCRLNLRVCACPGRDKKSEEKDSSKKAGSSKVVTADFGLVTGPANKRFKQNDNDEYTIVVKGRHRYEIIKEVLGTLDKYNCIPNSSGNSSLESNVLKRKPNKCSYKMLPKKHSKGKQKNVDDSE